MERVQFSQLDLVVHINCLVGCGGSAQEDPAQPNFFRDFSKKSPIYEATLRSE